MPLFSSRKMCCCLLLLEFNIVLIENSRITWNSSVLQGSLSKMHMIYYDVYLHIAMYRATDMLQLECELDSLQRNECAYEPRRCLQPCFLSCLHNIYSHLILMWAQPMYSFYKNWNEKMKFYFKYKILYRAVSDVNRFTIGSVCIFDYVTTELHACMVYTCVHSVRVPLWVTPIYARWKQSLWLNNDYECSLVTIPALVTLRTIMRNVTSVVGSEI